MKRWTRRTLKWSLFTISQLFNYGAKRCDAVELSAWIRSCTWWLLYAAGTTRLLSRLVRQVSQPSVAGVLKLCSTLCNLLRDCPPLFKPLSLVWSNYYPRVSQHREFVGDTHCALILIVWVPLHSEIDGCLAYKVSSVNKITALSDRIRWEISRWEISQCIIKKTEGSLGFFDNYNKGEPLGKVLPWAYTDNGGLVNPIRRYSHVHIHCIPHVTAFNVEWILGISDVETFIYVSVRLHFNQATSRAAHDLIRWI